MAANTKEGQVPKFKITKGHDAWVLYTAVIEADTAEEARAIAADVSFDGPWEEAGTQEFDHYDVFEEVEKLEEGEENAEVA
jgi:hypothetical protein